ncbi:MAG: efflux RND transporter periplasmic adaptor subunit, partial [Calditrichota bacterium]
MKTLLNPKFLFILIPALLIIVSCSSDDPVEEAFAKRTPVRVVPVQKATLSPTIRTAGRLATKAESRLSFKTGGILSRILADEGKRVKKGQLLAQLDMREINAQVKAAKSAAEKAERDLQRVKALFADSVSTLEQLQDAETGRDVAVAQLEVARFNQQYSSIFAPANGSVLKRFAERNELVSPGVPVFTFSSSSDSWIVRCGVSETDLIQIALGDRAEVNFDPYPNQT